MCFPAHCERNFPRCLYIVLSPCGRLMAVGTPNIFYPVCPSNLFPPKGGVWLTLDLPPPPFTFFAAPFPPPLPSLRKSACWAKKRGRDLFLLPPPSPGWYLLISLTTASFSFSSSLKTAPSSPPLSYTIAPSSSSLSPIEGGGGGGLRSAG